MRRAIGAAVAALGVACAGEAGSPLLAPIVTVACQYVPGAAAVSYAVGAAADGVLEHVSNPTTATDAGCLRYVSWGGVPDATVYRIYRWDGATRVEIATMLSRGARADAPSTAYTYVDDRCP